MRQRLAMDDGLAIGQGDLGADQERVHEPADHRETRPAQKWAICVAPAFGLDIRFGSA